MEQGFVEVLIERWILFKREYRIETPDSSTYVAPLEKLSRLPLWNWTVMGHLVGLVSKSSLLLERCVAYHPKANLQRLLDP